MKGERIKYGEEKGGKDEDGGHEGVEHEDIEDEGAGCVDEVDNCGMLGDITELRSGVSFPSNMRISAVFLLAKTIFVLVDRRISDDIAAFAATAAAAVAGGCTTTSTAAWTVAVADDVINCCGCFEAAGVAWSPTVVAIVPGKAWCCHISAQASCPLLLYSSLLALAGRGACTQEGMAT
jgi:hypothetical protein